VDHELLIPTQGEGGKKKIKSKKSIRRRIGKKENGEVRSPIFKKRGKRGKKKRVEKEKKGGGGGGEKGEKNNSIL